MEGETSGWTIDTVLKTLLWNVVKRSKNEKRDLPGAGDMLRSDPHHVISLQIWHLFIRLFFSKQNGVFHTLTLDLSPDTCLIGVLFDILFVHRIWVNLFKTGMSHTKIKPSSYEHIIISLCYWLFAVTSAITFPWQNIITKESLLFFVLRSFSDSLLLMWLSRWRKISWRKWLARGWRDGVFQPPCLIEILALILFRSF